MIKPRRPAGAPPAVPTAPSGAPPDTPRAPAEASVAARAAPGGALPGAPAAPTAALVIVGDEILSGRVADQNAPFLLAALRARGVRVCEVRTVGDGAAAIARAMAALAEDVDRVIVTGGVGPTHDDVTVDALALFGGVEVVAHEALVAFWRGQGGKMQLAPEGAAVHLAPPGARPQVPVVQLGKVLLLPGVPELMRSSFLGLDLWGRGAPFLAHAFILAVDERALAAPLAALQAAWPDVQIGSYPEGAQEGAPRVRVTLGGQDPGRLAGCTRAARAALLGAWLVGEEG